MYDGNNPTALQSIEWITNALLILMKEKPYSKITIMDICKKADLSRQTFYNFFNDKDDVLHYCIQRCFINNELRKEDNEILYLDEITDTFFVLFEKNASLFQLIIDQNLDHILANVILTSLQNFSSQFIPSSDSPTNSDYGNIFVTGGLTSILIYWFKNFRQTTPKDLSELLYKILTGNYMNTLTHNAFYFRYKSN